MTSAVLIGIIGKLAGLPVLSRYFLPLMNEPDGTVGLLNPRHLLDVTNLILLSALPAVVLIVASLRRKSSDRESAGYRTTVALSLILASLAFLLFFTPELGAARDWDLFSLAAWLLLPGGLLLYSERRTSRLGPELLPLVGIGLTVGLCFAIINHNPALSAERYIQLLKQDKGHNHFIDYASLSRLSENYPELREMSYAFANDAWEAPPRNLTDSAYIASRIVQLSIVRRDQRSAGKFLTVLQQLDTLDLNTYRLYEAYIEQFSSLDKLPAVAAEVDRRFPNDALGQMQAGIMYMKANQSALGGAHLERAWQIDSTLFLVQLNWGNFLLKDRQYSEAARVLRRAVTNEPNQFLARANLALAAVLSGDHALAHEQVLVLNNLATTQTDRQRIDQILNLLGK